MTHSTPSTATREELLEACDTLDKIDGVDHLDDGELHEIHIAATALRAFISSLNSGDGRIHYEIGFADGRKSSTKEQRERLLSPKTSEGELYELAQMVVKLKTGQTATRINDLISRAERIIYTWNTRTEQQPAITVSDGVVVAAYERGYNAALSALPNRIEQQQSRYENGFEAGKNSVMRDNRSGCCCLINEDDEIVKLCAAHKDYFEQQQGRQDVAKYLCNGTRFKLSFTETGDCYSFMNYQHQLQGRWVALVAAENDMHLAAPNKPSGPTTAGRD